VFSDTPGILDPKYKLHEYMMESIDEAFEDADILLYLTTVEENPQEHAIPEQLSKISVPLIITLNKVDLTKSQEQVMELVEQWKVKFPNAYIIPVSATHNFNIKTLLQQIIDILPEHAPYFEGDEVSDRNTRFFMSEIIREKIFMYFHQEVPYSSEVIIDEFIEEEEIDKIYATIYVSRDSQKVILIGENGKAIKHVGIKAREDMEKFLGKHVFLDMHVKVLKNWRNDINILKRLGYSK
jgi:GTP-binding protein Era